MWLAGAYSSRGMVWRRTRGLGGLGSQGASRRTAWECSGGSSEGAHSLCVARSSGGEAVVTRGTVAHSAAV